jgi:hypothetical protein
MRSPRVSDQKPVKSLEKFLALPVGSCILRPLEDILPFVFEELRAFRHAKSLFDFVQSDSAGEQTRSMDVRIKATLSFSIGGSALEDSLAEYDELTVSGLLKEILDKAIACDGIQVEVTEGPNTLEEYDSQAQGA